MEEQEKKDLLPELEEVGEELTEKHLKILEAAVRLFAQKGYSASSTSEIAKTAGVSEGTIFNYFKTKKELLHGLLVPLTDRVLRPFVLAANPQGEREMEEMLYDLMVDQVQLIENNLPLVKAMTVEAAFHPELLAPLKLTILQAVKSMVALINEEQERGHFRDDVDPTRAMRVFLSLLLGYVLMRHAFDDVFPFEEEKQELAGILDLFLHGVKTK
jgi:AcrR family transcriptional regulator